MKNIINKIVNILYEQRGYDFTGNRFSMLERRISKRLSPTKTTNLEEYFKYLVSSPDEFDNLIDLLTINVSSFFRNPLFWEYTAKFVLPEILKKKKMENDNCFRIWSAGCASGEEAYSIAILVSELLEHESKPPDVFIFATDIDKEILKKAEEAVFNFAVLSNTKVGLLKKYFSENNDCYTLSGDIQKMVNFSFFDLFDKKRYVPAESVFGGFDIVFCRNVLIYFKSEFQEKIFDKLYYSLNKGGYLVLGSSEVIIEKYKKKFNKVSKDCKIYQKE